MPDIVLAAALEYSKGKELFDAAEGLDFQPASEVEESLAEAVLASDCRAVVLGVEPYRGPLYDALGKTGGARGAIIARFGVGHDGVDKALAKQHNIVVTNAPGVLDQSVAEHTMWLAGTLIRHVAVLDAGFRAGQFEPRTGQELAGKTLGIVGFGAIGRRVAHIAHCGFGMNVLAADCRPLEQLEAQEGKSFEQLKTAYGLELYTDDSAAVFREADVASIHLPAADETRRFVAADRLRLMKPTALLVNTSRGWLLDEDALYDALADGRIAGAGLDVFENEPYRPVSPGKDLRTLGNVVLTPHISSNTRESNQRMARVCLDNLTKFFAGRLDELTRVDVPA